MAAAIETALRKRTRTGNGRIALADVATVEETAAPSASSATKLEILPPKQTVIHKTAGFQDAYGLCIMCHSEKEIGVLTGPPGIGKTTTIREFAKDYSGEVILITARPEMSVRDFIQQLANLLGLGILYGSNYERATSVVEELQKRPRTIIVDEAENLARSSISKLEILRRIYDDAETGLVLVGTPRLKTLLVKGPSRRENLSQLYSRISYLLEVSGLTAEDVGNILAPCQVADTARKELWQVAADTDHGGTRMFFKLWNLVQKIAAMNGGDITRDIVKQAMSKYLLTGK